MQNKTKVLTKVCIRAITEREWDSIGDQTQSCVPGQPTVPLTQLPSGSAAAVTTEQIADRVPGDT